MPGESLLIVDDTPANVQLLQAVLKSKGYDVRTAGNADEALASIAQTRPALILMDLQLPGIDGLTLTKRLRGEPGGQDVRIIAVTSYAMRGDREKALAAGCDDYVTKPIDTRALPLLIAEHLARRTPSSGP